MRCVFADIDAASSLISMLERTMNAVVPLSRPDVPTGRTSPFRAIPAVGVATEEDHPILHAAVTLGERIRDAGDEIEQGRRIPPAIAAAIKDAGVFGMAMPHAWGGPNWIR
jgi:hypothetical protein